MLPDKLFEQMDELIALYEKQTDLMRKLKRGYLLANVIGMHPKDIKGAMTTHIDIGGSIFSKPWQAHELVVRLDGVEVARKKLIDVPQDLWPTDVSVAYQHHLRRKNKTSKE